MSSLTVENGLQTFYDNQGNPLNYGFVYVGPVNVDPVTNPANVYWDFAQTIPAQQPIRTVNGRPVRNGSPSNFYVNGDYSITVKDSKNSVLYYSPNSNSMWANLASSDPFKGATMVNGATRSVDTYAAVRAFTGDATRLVVCGRTGNFDGAAGFFEVDSSDMTSADNDGTILVDSRGRRWKRSYADPINVAWFGGVGDGVSDDTSAQANAFSAKVGATSAVRYPIGTFKLATQISMTGYNTVSGYGDQSQIKLSSPSMNGLAYTSQTGVFDDHPHNVIQDIRITGDGVFASYPSAQTGTTTGLNLGIVSNIGSLFSTKGATFELNSIGKYVKSSYVHGSEACHYRANKIGLSLEEVTSYSELNSYFRYNSTAAVQITGGQNVRISGGAIEGNPGVGLKYVAGSSTWGQINLENVYFESNGNEATGIWSIDVPFGSPAMVNIRGGNFWRNVSSSVASGPFRFGDNVTIDGATVGGSHYAVNAAVKNTRGIVSWNTMGTESLSRLFGLTEPVRFKEYRPAVYAYDFSAATSGLVFRTEATGRGPGKLPGVTNLASPTYPYGFSASSGATGAENAGLNYGDGSFFRVTYAASAGNFSSNYATLHNFTDTTKPYRVVAVVVYPESDCEIGITQSVGGQSINGYFSLKANKFYRLVMCGFTPMSAGSFLRVYPLNTAAPIINFCHTWASQHATHDEQLKVMDKLVVGLI